MAAKYRKPRIPRAPRKTTCLCINGPFHHERILLEAPGSGTLTFTVNGVRGRYVPIDPANPGTLRWRIV